MKFDRIVAAVSLLLTGMLGACGGGDEPAAPPVPKTWRTPTPVEADNLGSAYGPQIAVDSAGNAWAVWYQSDGTRSNIWANRFTVGSGWGTAVRIETDDAGDALYPQIAVDSAGNAVAVWQQSDGTRDNIWANRYAAGSGWGTATLIETDDVGNARAPQIAVDRAGNALAVWYQSDGATLNILANRYTAGGNWSTAAPIETHAGAATQPQIAIDTAGNGWAVWSQSDGTRTNVWANRYTAGGWGTATLIETDNTGAAALPQVAVDTAGNAWAVWQQSDGARDNIWANRFTVAGGWGTPTPIETDNAGGARAPQLAIDSAGNTLVVWSQSNGTRYDVWANRYASGSWGIAALIETDNVASAAFPQIAIDPAGNALAVWHQADDTRNNIWSNRYTAGSGWATATLIETDNTGHAYDPQIAVDSAGNALAVWQQSNGTRSDISGNRYE